MIEYYLKTGRTKLQDKGFHVKLNLNTFQNKYCGNFDLTLTLVSVCPNVTWKLTEKEA